VFDTLRYKAVVFDVRDTLLVLDEHYERVLYLKIIREFGRRSGNRYLASFDQRDLEQLLSMKHWKRREALERFGLDPDTFQSLWLSDEALEIRMRHSHLQPDAHVLRYLKRAGVRIGVVTSSPKRAADVDIGLVKGKIGSRVFDEVVIPSYEPNLPHKPDPRPVLTCLERLSVRPSEAVGVGSSQRDIIAYRRAGILDVLVERRRLAPQDRPEASVVVSNLLELAPILVERGWLSRVLGWGRTDLYRASQA